MIHVIASIEVKPENRAQLLAAFAELVPQVKAEEGCLEYGPAIDLATPIERQTPPRDNVITVIEKWESVPALQAHLVAPHMDAFRERVQDLVDGLTLQVLEPA